MDKNPSFYKNLLLSLAVLLGVIWLLLSLISERTGNGGLMHSFFVELQELEAAGKLSAWKNEEEGLYYVFLPAAQNKLQSKLKMSSSFGEYSLGIEGMTADEQGFFSCETDTRYRLEWKLLGRMTVKTCDLMFVKSEQIPALMIQTENRRSFAADTADKESYQEIGYLTLITADGSIALKDGRAILGGRGNSTWTAAKKPLKFELNQPAGLLGMEEAVKYNLIANAYDGSHMRNKLMLDMANAISGQYMVDGEWVELYYNGEYEGLYLLTEKVEIGENRLDIASLEAENEEVNPEGPSKYKEFTYEEEYHGMTIKGVEIPNSPKDITGSYLIEMDMRIRYEEAPCGFITGRGQPFTIENPGYITKSELQYIADVAADVESALFSEDGISDISRKRLEELMDLTSFADAYLYGEISGEQDTGISSQYLYKKPDSESTLLYAGPIWDFDGCLGNTSPEMYAYPECLAISVEEVRGSETGISNRWFAALTRHEVFMDTVKERFEAVFYEQGCRIINEKIDAYTETIRKAALLDRLRWNQDSGSWPFIWPEGYEVDEQEVKAYGYPAYDRLDSQVNQIKSFLQRKLDFLYDLWVNQTEYHRVYVKPDAEFLSDTMFYGRYYWVRDGACLPELPHYTSDWYPGEQYHRKGYVLAETGEAVDVTAPIRKAMNIIDQWEKGDKAEE